MIGLTGISAHAQAAGVRAQVPFSFAASGKTFPAGEYTMIPDSQLVQIQDLHGKTVALVLANEISGRATRASGQIIFHCYRQRCFLAEVWSPVEKDGKQLLISRTEAGLAEERPAKYFSVSRRKISDPYFQNATCAAVASIPKD